MTKLACFVGMGFALVGCAGDADDTKISDQNLVERRIGLRFTETITGTFYENDRDATPAHLFAKEREGGGVELAITVEANAPDLDGLIDEPEHEVALTGTVTIGSLRGERVVAPTRGTLRVLAVDPSTQIHEFRYEVTFLQRNVRYRVLGKKYALDDGTEKIDPFFDREVLRPLRGTALGDAYTDTTTVYATVYDERSGASVGSGLMRFETLQSPEAVMSALAFLRSFDVTGTDDPLEKARGLLAFERFVFGELVRIYGPF
jgi:hypothetical protein